MENTKNLLLVDDDPDSLDLMSQALSDAGYAVVCCATSKEAVRCALEKPFDLVITDLMMESLDSGFSLSRWIKEYTRPREVPVVVVTAIGRQCGYDFNPRSPEELRAMFADAYLEKPVPAQVLLEQVQSLLHRQEVLENNHE